MADKYPECSTALAIRETRTHATARQRSPSLQEVRQRTVWGQHPARCTAAGSRTRSHSESRLAPSLKRHLPHHQAITRAASAPEKRKLVLHMKTTMGTFTEALLVIAKKPDTGRCPPWEDGETPWGICECHPATARRPPNTRYHLQVSPEN